MYGLWCANCETKQAGASRSKFMLFLFFFIVQSVTITLWLSWQVHVVIFFWQFIQVTVCVCTSVDWSFSFCVPLAVPGTCMGLHPQRLRRKCSQVQSVPFVTAHWLCTVSPVSCPEQNCLPHKLHPHNHLLYREFWRLLSVSDRSNSCHCLLKKIHLKGIHKHLAYPYLRNKPYRCGGFHQMRISSLMGSLLTWGMNQWTQKW